MHAVPCPPCCSALGLAELQPPGPRSASQPGSCRPPAPRLSWVTQVCPPLAAMTAPPGAWWKPAFGPGRWWQPPESCLGKSRGDQYLPSEERPCTCGGFRQAARAVRHDQPGLPGAVGRHFAAVYLLPSLSPQHMLCLCEWDTHLP